MYMITTVKIRRSWDRLIFIIGIPLPSRQLCIKSGRRLCCLFLRFGDDCFRGIILRFSTRETTLNYVRTSYTLINYEQKTIGPRAYFMSCSVMLLRLWVVSWEYFIILQIFFQRQCWALWPVTRKNHQVHAIPNVLINMKGVQYNIDSHGSLIITYHLVLCSSTIKHRLFVVYSSFP